jgi:hypothetical protein
MPIDGPYIHLLTHGGYIHLMLIDGGYIQLMLTHGGYIQLMDS